jgi:hypothetical protein
MTSQEISDQRALDFTTQWDETTSFPFIEDENANITGYGHQDPDAFAAEVNRYDEVCNDGAPFSEDEQWSGAHVGHRWAVLDQDGERLWTEHEGQPVTASTPGAFPITTLWGQR